MSLLDRHKKELQEIRRDPSIPDETGQKYREDTGVGTQIRSPAETGGSSNLLKRHQQMIQQDSDLHEEVRKATIKETKGIPDRVRGFMADIYDMGERLFTEEKPKETVVELDRVGRREKIDVEPKKGVWETLRDSSKRTYHNTAAEILSTRAVTRAFSDRLPFFSFSEEGTYDLLDRAEERREIAREFQKDVEKIEDIDTFSDFGRWVGSTSIEMVPIVGSIMIGGYIGGAAGGVAGSAIGKSKIGARVATSGVGKLAAKTPKLGGLTSQQLGTISGSTMGTFSVGYASYAGTIFEEAVRQGAEIDDATSAALRYGAPAAAVSIVFPAMIASYTLGAFGKAAMKSKIRVAAEGIMVGAPSEGVAEGIAEIFTIMGEQVAQGKDISASEILRSEEGWSRVKNAMAGGALMGFGFGALGGAARSKKQITPNDIIRATDDFLDATDQAMELNRTTRRGEVEDNLLGRLREIEDPSAEQQQLINFLQERVDDARLDVNKYDSLMIYDEQMMEVLRQDEGYVRERLKELALKKEPTLVEAAELSAIMVNKPKLAHDVVTKLRPEDVPTSPDYLADRIVYEIAQPGQWTNLNDIHEAVEGEGYSRTDVDKAVDILERKNLIDRDQRYAPADSIKTKPEELGLPPDSDNIPDAIDEIYKGKRKIKVPTTGFETEVREAMRKGDYMRIFSKDKGTAIDEIADELGITPSQLVDELIERSKGNKRLIVPDKGPLDTRPSEIQEMGDEMPRHQLGPPEDIGTSDFDVRKKQSIKKRFPHIHELRKRNVDWNKLDKTQKEAVRIWYNQKDSLKERIGAVESSFGKEARDSVESYINQGKTGEQFAYDLFRKKEDVVAPKDIPNALEKVKTNVEFYQSMGTSYEGDIQPENAALRDLKELAEDKKVKQRTQEQVKQITEKDGMITLYRVGEVTDVDRLVSATYDKKFADKFAEAVLSQSKTKPKLTEFRVSPDEVKIFIGGAESEVLVHSLIHKRAVEGEEANINVQLGKLHFRHKEEAKAFYNMIEGDPELPSFLREPEFQIDETSQDPVIDPPVTKESEVGMLSRQWTTDLNIKTNKKRWFTVLRDIAFDLGVSEISYKPHKKDLLGTFWWDKYNKLNYGITLKETWSLATLGHEVGHVFDYVVIQNLGDLKKPRSMKQRISKRYDKMRENVNNMPWTDKKKQEVIDRIESFKDGEFIKEIENLIKYTKNWDRRTEREEMFANWFLAYLNDYDTTVAIAPKFTEAMEMTYMNELQSVRSKYKIPAEDTEILNLPPAKKARKGIDNYLRGLQQANKLMKHDDTVEWIQNYRNSLKKLPDKYLNILGMPYGESMRNPHFRDMYKPVQDYGVNEDHKTKVEWLEKSGIRKIRKLPEASKRKLAYVLYQGTDMEEVYTDQQLETVFGMDSQERAYYKRVREVLDEVRDKMIETRKFETGYYDMTAQKKKDIDRHIQNQIKELTGYFPKTRSGKWIVFAGKDYNAKTGTYETIAYDHFHYAKQPLIAQDAPNAADFAQHLKDMKAYDRIVVKEWKDLPKEMQRSMTKQASWWELQKIIDNSGVDRTDPEIQKIVKQIEKKTTEGWKKRIAKRKNVPGLDYTFENFEHSLLDIIDDVSRAHARAKAKYHCEKAREKMYQAEKDGKVSSEAVARAEKWFEHYFNQAGNDSWVTLRKGIYWWYLGWKVSYFFQNALQPVMTTLGEVGKHASISQTPKHWGRGYGLSIDYFLSRKAGNDFIKIAPKSIQNFLQGKRRQGDPLFYELMDRAVMERAISGQFQEQMLGVRNPKMEALQNVIGAFGVATETINRSHAMATAYDIAVNQYKMKDKNKIYEFMKEMNYNTQFPYGKHNIPFGLTKVGEMKGPLRTMFVFRSFSLNYLDYFMRMMTTGTSAQKFYGISSMITIGGIRGLPFYAILNALIGWIWKRDVTENIDALFDEEDEWIGDFLIGGAFSWANMSTSQLLGVGDIVSPTYDPMGQALGAGYGLAGDIKYGMDLYKEGDLERAYERFSPIALRNIQTAFRWQEEGIDFGRDVVHEPEGWDLYMKALSFTPYDVSRQYDKRNMADRYRDSKTRLGKRYTNAIKRGESTESIIESIEKHNRIVEDELYKMYYHSKIPISVDSWEKIENSILIDFDDIFRWEDRAYE